MDNAVIFQTVDESDIEYVQNIIRTSLHDILISKSKEIGFVYDEKCYPHFFGVYIEDRAGFTFSECDILKIQLCVAHIKSILKSNCLSHFNDNVAEKDCRKLFFCDETDQLELKSNEKEQKPESIKIKNSITHTLLNKLICTANQNALRTKPGYRYSDEIRNFASYVRIISGRLAYQTIQNNLPLALPAFSSTNRYITQKHDRVIEGQLRIKELSDYLDQRKLPRIVALSEDATRINGIPQYDSKSNEVLGFVLPLGSNGMPVPHSFPARNFREIYTYFHERTPCAHFVNVIMAQPMADVPAICILLFCSNSQYKAEDVAHRWEFISKELKKENIRVLAVSSDSDPKYNSAMRKCTQLGSRSNIFKNGEWFKMSAYEELKDAQPVDQPYYVQDTIHIATKLRNMFLKTMKIPNMLPFGPKFYIRAKHIESVMMKFPKDQHRLTPTVLNREDKQNFESVLRLCDESVIQLLKSGIPGSEATVKFLQIMRDVIDAYRDKDLTPLQRIEKIWNAVFILRIWKTYISFNKHLSTEKNFLTNNCYSCIEINAHSLILIMLDLKNNKSDMIFKPPLLESQPCEAIFRQLRSMTTVYSTVTNFSLREIIDRINRIELQSEIAATTSFVFPRIKTGKNIPSANHELPSKEQIFVQIEQCKKNSIKFARRIGLIKNDIQLSCTIVPLTFKTKALVLENDKSDVHEEFIDAVRNTKLIQFETLTLKNFADTFTNELIPENSRFVEVPGIRCRKVIKKSSLVWLLRADSEKLSSDRLYRVRARFPKRLLRKKNTNLKIKKKVVHFNLR